MSFSLLISLRAIPNDDDFVLESEDYNKIWQFLTSRNEKINENTQLSFQSVISKLIDSIEVEQEIRVHENLNQSLSAQS